MILQISIAHNNVDSFHCQLDELVRLHQNDKWLKKLPERSLCYAAYVGSNLVIETLIQNGVGEEKSVGLLFLQQQICFKSNYNMLYQ